LFVDLSCVRHQHNLNFEAHLFGMNVLAMFSGLSMFIPAASNGVFWSSLSFCLFFSAVREQVWMVP